MKLTIAGSYSEIRSWILDTARGLEKDKKDGHDWLGKLPSIHIAEDAGKAFGEYQRAVSHTDAAPAEEQSVFRSDAFEQDGLSRLAVTVYYVIDRADGAVVSPAMESLEEARSWATVQQGDAELGIRAVTVFDDGCQVQETEMPDGQIETTKLICSECAGIDFWRQMEKGFTPYMTNRGHVPEGFRRGSQG